MHHLFLIALLAQSGANMQALVQAERWLDSEPKKTLAAYELHQANIETLSAKARIRWYKVGAEAAFKLSDLAQAEVFLGRLSSVAQALAGTRRFPYFINLTGIWFRKSGYLRQASAAYACARDKALNPKEKARSMINLAVAQRNLGYIDKATETNKAALALVKGKNNPVYESVISNNLGIIYLSTGKFDDAVPYLKRAYFLNTREGRALSEVRSLVSLLWALIETGDYALYDRLYLSALTKIERLDTHEISAYLSWVQSYREFKRTPGALDTDKKQYLLQAYQRIKDKGLQSLIHPIAGALGVEVERHQLEIRDYDGPLLALLEHCS